MDIVERLRDYIQGERDYLVEITKMLVSIPTVNPPGENYLRICEEFEKIVGDIGISETEIVEIPDDYVDGWNVERNDEKRYCFLAEWTNGDYPTLHLTGHFDVVPTTSNWTRDPFEPVVEGDRLYGRGSADMKSIITSMILATKALMNCVDEPNFNITLSFTCDEEIGGETGAGYLNEKGLVKGDFALIEGLHQEGIITRLNKAILWLEIEVIGKPAHSSEPYKGTNAFVGAMMAVEALSELEEELKSVRTDFELMDERHGYTTMNIGSVSEGGTKENTVCDRFRFTVDCRVIPETDLDGLIETVRETITGALEGTEYRFELRTKHRVSAIDGDPDERYIPLVKDAYEKVTGETAKVCLAPFFTDMRHFLKGGIPILGLGVDCEGVHGDDENVSISGMLEISLMMAMVALGLGERG